EQKNDCLSFNRQSSRIYGRGNHFRLRNHCSISACRGSQTWMKRFRGASTCGKSSNLQTLSTVRRQSTPSFGFELISALLSTETGMKTTLPF
ncbi:MAG: hypothetical protein ACXW3J_05370, partial [Methylocystis sp.]